MSGLQQLRDQVKVPIIITSGYRCTEYNKKIKGARNSYHLSGDAADIVITGMNVLEMYKAASEIPVFNRGGIGLYDGGFIHLDARTTKARWGRIEGEYVGLLHFIADYKKRETENGKVSK
jgi:uncharacterized protein YcbK (DUF882 family)